MLREASTRGETGSGIICDMLTRLVVPVAAVVALLAGCTLNAGSAFAEQYSAYLDSVPVVAEHQVRGNNDAPAHGSADTTVTLVAGLDPSRVADVVTELANHRVDQAVGEHRLTVRFWTPNGAGEQVLGSVSWSIEDDADALVVSDVAPHVRRAVDFLAADAQLTDLMTGVGVARVRTTGDPFETTERASILAEGATTEFFQITVSTDVGHVSVFAGDSVDALRPLDEVLDAVPDGVEVTRWRATSQNATREPLFEIALAAGTGDDVVRVIESAARAAGITVEVTVAVG